MYYAYLLKYMRKNTRFSTKESCKKRDRSRMGNGFLPTLFHAKPSTVDGGLFREVLDVVWMSCLSPP